MTNLSRMHAAPWLDFDAAIQLLNSRQLSRSRPLEWRFRPGCIRPDSPSQPELGLVGLVGGIQSTALGTRNLYALDWMPALHWTGALHWSTMETALDGSTALEHCMEHCTGCRHCTGCLQFSQCMMQHAFKRSSLTHSMKACTAGRRPQASWLCARQELDDKCASLRGIH